MRLRPVIERNLGDGRARSAELGDRVSVVDAKPRKTPLKKRR